MDKTHTGLYENTKNKTGDHTARRTALLKTDVSAICLDMDLQKEFPFYLKIKFMNCVSSSGFKSNFIVQKEKYGSTVAQW